MSLPLVENLKSLPATSHRELLAEPVADAIAGWAHAEHVAVVEIDAAFSDTAAMMKAYNLPLTTGANCVIVAGKRGGEERVAACVVRSDTHVDINTVAKRTLDVRRPSFLPMDRATIESGMEYGAITPIGLPAAWRLLVDPRVLSMTAAIIGSGRRGSKLLLQGNLLAELPGAEVINDLGRDPRA
ncbi:YbaK/EbsC family protein [Nocardia sp. NPDC055002]